MHIAIIHTICVVYTMCGADANGVATVVTKARKIIGLRIIGGG